MTRKDCAALARTLPVYLRKRRWFRGKARAIARVAVEDTVSLGDGPAAERVVLASVAYAGGGSETYVLVLPGGPKRKAEGIREAVSQMRFCRKLLAALAEGRCFEGAKGSIVFVADDAFRRVVGRAKSPLEPSVSKAEQSNTSIVLGKRYILKLYRCVEPGIHPELEVGRFLTAKGFKHSPSVAGHMEYRPRTGEPTALGLLQTFVATEGDGWQNALAAVRKCLSSAGAGLPPPRRQLLGPYARLARLLGRRTAEMHLILGSETEDPSFAPEPFTRETQRSLRDGLVRSSRRVLDLLASRVESLQDAVREKARRVLDLRGAIEGRFESVLTRKLESTRIRCHGDYHLGQVLFTGSDFVITDFEGEVARPLAERRAKSSPLKDVAGMMRSFHYAAHAELIERQLEPWARAWYSSASGAFLKAYLKSMRAASFFPGTREERELLLDAYLLEKAIYEIGYELNNRPDWLKIPLEGVLEILENQGRP